MPFTFSPMEIPDVLLIEACAFPDERGFFAELYREGVFSAGGMPHFVQDNFSWSHQHVLRGLHYQNPPMAQAKLVSVAFGEIYDVAVDIRRHSPTYGRYVAAALSAENHRMLFVPEGFAHGICVLSQHAAVMYKVSAEYSPALERGILWNDPDLAISWPTSSPTLSPKDAVQPRLKDVENPFV